MTSGVRTSASVLVVTRATNINTAVGCGSRTTNSIKALSSFRCHELQHDPKWLHLPLTSGWPLREQSPRTSPAALTPNVHLFIRMCLRLRGVLGQQHRPQQLPTQSLQGPQSRLLRWPNSASEPFFCSILAQSQGDPAARQQVQGPSASA